MKRIFTLGRMLCLAMAIALTALGVWGLKTDTREQTSETRLIEMHRQGVGMLTAQGASQTFIAQEDDLAEVSVMYSNYNKKVSEGTVTLALLDAAGAELARAEYPVQGLRNNTFLSVALPEAQADSAGQPYTLRVTADCVEQKGVTVRMGPLDAPQEGMTLTLADGTTDTGNALNLRCTYRATTYGWMAGMTCWLLALCFVACIPLAGRKERTHA